MVCWERGLNFENATGVESGRWPFQVDFEITPEAEYVHLVAKAKIRVAQLKSEIHRLEGQATQLAQQAKPWAERARRVHVVDESKALASVERMTQIQVVHRQVSR